MQRWRLFVLAIFCFLTGTASAETIDVFDNHGGSVVEYDQHWTELASRGVNVRIVGPCQSACTVLLGHIPRSQICVTPRAAFGFHQAHLASATAILWNAYSPDIQAWINRHGGLTPQFIWLHAPEIFRYFHRC